MPDGSTHLRKAFVLTGRGDATFAALAKLDAQLAASGLSPSRHSLPASFDGLADSIAAASAHQARFGGEDR